MDISELTGINEHEAFRKWNINCEISSIGNASEILTDCSWELPIRLDPNRF